MLANQQPPMRLDNLPREILVLIAKKSDPVTAARLGATGRQFRAVHQEATPALMDKAAAVIVRQIRQLINWSLSKNHRTNIVKQTPPRTLAHGLKVLCEYHTNELHAYPVTIQVKLVDANRRVVCQRTLAVGQQFGTGREVRITASYSGRLQRVPLGARFVCKLFHDVLRRAANMYAASPITISLNTLLRQNRM